VSPAGRRPGDSGTRDAILRAARAGFSARGFNATSLRSIARDAGVDPALITHYFGSKDDVFEAALALPLVPETLVPLLLAEGVEGLGERIVRTFLGVWDNTPGQGPMLAMLRSAVSHEDSAERLRGLLTRVLLHPLAEGTGSGDADLRASLLASQVAGLALARYVLKIEPLASATADELAPLLGPTLQRYLTGALTGTLT
jgi:AcrR family transcriptional regulator